MKYEKIDEKSFKSVETETIQREEIYNAERLRNMEQSINEHIDILNHKLTNAQEKLNDCLELVRIAKGFKIKFSLSVREKKS